MTDQKRRLTVLPDAAAGLLAAGELSRHDAKDELDDELKAKLEAVQKDDPAEVFCAVYSYTKKDKEGKFVKPKEKEAKDLRTIELAGEEIFDKLPIGRTCLKGKKPEAPNQDNFVVLVAIDKFAFYGVFDGHGPNGHEVADVASKYLVTKFFEGDNRTTNIKEHMKTVFEKTQKHIQAWSLQEGTDGKGKDKDGKADASGTTCTICYHDFQRGLLTIAHVGDSRCILWNGSEDASNEAFSKSGKGKATEDHKPDLPAEKARIESRGGRVVFDGYYNHRVFAQKGMYPGLNMSRALGDLRAHAEAGLTEMPDVITYDLKEAKDWYLLLCTDGVWEFIDNPSASQMIRDSSFQASTNDELAVKTKGAMLALAECAYDKWMEDSDNEISDDISGVLVQLTASGFRQI